MSKRGRFLVVAVGLWVGHLRQADSRAQDVDPGVTKVKPNGAARADLKIVYWYDRRHPLDTFHHQVYDLRKGEFTPAVETWLAMMKRDYPDYAAYARPLDLSTQQRENENYKIGDAVVQEFLIIAAQNGIDLTGFVPAPRSAVSAREYRASTRRYPPGSGSFTPRPLGGIGSQTPTSVTVPLTPFPIPYPRPHP